MWGPVDELRNIFICVLWAGFFALLLFRIFVSLIKHKELLVINEVYWFAHY